MYPIKFDGANCIRSEPSGWDREKYGVCRDLPLQIKDGVCKSCWKLSFVEVVKLVFKRKIFLYVVSGITQPPVRLEIK